MQMHIYMLSCICTCTCTCTCKCKCTYACTDRSANIAHMHACTACAHILAHMHACRDAAGRTGTHICMRPGTQRDATGTHRDAAGRGETRQGQGGGGAAGHLRTASPSHTGITSRAHTASRHDHVTDTEHDFPVRGDGQAGLTPPTSNFSLNLVPKSIPSNHEHLFFQ